ncbi:MAG: outer membrane lipoprotein carrier protein LolA [Leptospirales bacterium]
MKKTIPFLFIFAITQVYAVDYIHSTDIVDKVKAKFKGIETYSADFTIKTVEKKNNKTYRGKAYYKKGGNVNFTFTEPYGDIIISNGKKMWIYIKKMKTVGVQELNSPKDAGVTGTTGYEGVMSMFTRYHYSYDTPEQPRTVDGKSYYILNLKEKVSSGGFSTMTVYVNATTSLIEKLVATNNRNKTVTLTYKNIKLNPELPPSLFYFKVEGRIQTVNNPLTTVE